MHNKFYVYKHYAKSGKVYIGKGSGNRITNFKNRNTSPYWKHVFKHNYVCIEMVQEGLSENDAFDLEKRLIREYIDKGYKLYETLINGTLGGEGCSGLKHSKESKEKMSKAHIGKTSPKKGIKITDATILKNMSKAQTGKKRSKEVCEAISKRLLGKKRSKETCNAISKGKKGVPVSAETRKKIAETLSIPVICIESNTVYSSAKEASKKLGINHSNILQVCKAKRKTAGGFSWKYY